ncbi:hypothetical protein GWC77_26980 [Paraburkholderia sp. NMBU_R16]|uniref:hypothetical protein n=1 Tax=Paraburkholderia sp. NMBU_R16 TaxID=2698676 RepID=UPI0015630A8F|nr:hypothetical protein [Paraburkholderia sp. NMBU_R16]NRO99520.1 hypothetical protein [Paraburkholderia sp. NMBU_R16]
MIAAALNLDTTGTTHRARIEEILNDVFNPLEWMGESISPDDLIFHETPRTRVTEMDVFLDYCREHEDPELVKAAAVFRKAMDLTVMLLIGSAADQNGEKDLRIYFGPTATGEHAWQHVSTVFGREGRVYQSIPGLVKVVAHFLECFPEYRVRHAAGFSLGGGVVQSFMAQLAAVHEPVRTTPIVLVDPQLLNRAQRSASGLSGLPQNALAVTLNYKGRPLDSLMDKMGKYNYSARGLTQLRLGLPAQLFGRPPVATGISGYHAIPDYYEQAVQTFTQKVLPATYRLPRRLAAPKDERLVFRLLLSMQKRRALEQKRHLLQEASDAGRSVNQDRVRAMDDLIQRSAAREQGLSVLRDMRGQLGKTTKNQDERLTAERYAKRLAAVAATFRSRAPDDTERELLKIPQDAHQDFKEHRLAKADGLSILEQSRMLLRRM